MFLHVLSAILIFVVTRFLWRRWKYDMHKVPSPPGHPLFGHTFQLSNNEFPQHVLYLEDKFKKLGYPKMIRLDVMGSSFFYVRDMAFIRNVMMSKTHPFPRFFTSAASLMPFLGNDASAKFLFKVPTMSPYQKAIRKIYASVMQAQNLKKVTPRIIDQIDKMMDIIEQQREMGKVDLKELMTKLTLDVIGILAFEVNLGGLDGSRRIHALFNDVKRITVERFKKPMSEFYYRLFPWLSEARRRQNKIQDMLNEYAALIRDFDQREDPPDGEEPMWYALKTMKDPETQKPLEFKTLLAEVAMLIFAGKDTTAQQLSWILMLLAAHPKVTEKLLNELWMHGLYGPRNRPVDFDDLGNLPYLTAVIKEGMRIAYILSRFAPRLLPEDMTIVGYRLPKGSILTFPGTRAISLREEWGDPNVFRPERWLTGEDMSNKYNIGFSSGPRDCIGQKLAMLEMRLVIVKLITSYELKIDGRWKDVLNSASDGVIIEATNGVWFHVTPRDAANEW